MKRLNPFKTKKRKGVTLLKQNTISILNKRLKPLFLLFDTKLNTNVRKIKEYNN